MTSIQQTAAIIGVGIILLLAILYVPVPGDATDYSLSRYEPEGSFITLDSLKWGNLEAFKPYIEIMNPEPIPKPQIVQQPAFNINHRYRVKGIAYSSSSPFALLEDISDASTMAIGIGQPLASCIVEMIHPTQVDIRCEDNQLQSLTLDNSTQ